MNQVSNWECNKPSKVLFGDSTRSAHNTFNRNGNHFANRPCGLKWFIFAQAAFEWRGISASISLRCPRTFTSPVSTGVSSGVAGRPGRSYKISWNHIMDRIHDTCKVLECHWSKHWKEIKCRYKLQCPFKTITNIYVYPYSISQNSIRCQLDLWHIWWSSVP